MGDFFPELENFPSAFGGIKQETVGDSCVVM